ncbi:hypothetical protein PV08_06038 [Exophiala spinifera]|uniref:Methyltransferase domain-containing protein n=1 Tax=Exophiala spinifera TaxID=91928 RepID=A0A0D1ZT92_9EURO|nr:uncharacterized protein PV08_06038 [Exophiala spinifera]KIW15987.1 hypothetical protein PV08_06038 [Exophiala spinifera]
MSDPGGLRTEENVFLQRVYAATNAAESKDVYDEWATQYDRDLEGLDYAFPALAAEALSRAVARSSPGTADVLGKQLAGLRIADAGCGTGLVGRELAHFGADNISGLDVSPGMLEVARKTGCYAELDEVDLSKPIARPAGSFDAVVCVGTLTRGHVGPDPVFKEFVRVVKKGGSIVATVLDEIWESGGYKAEVERLEGLGAIEVLRADVVGVRTTSKAGGRLLVLTKL